jgi:hypothetical protein
MDDRLQPILDQKAVDCTRGLPHPRMPWEASIVAERQSAYGRAVYKAIASGTLGDAHVFLSGEGVLQARHKLLPPDVSRR